MARMYCEICGKTIQDECGYSIPQGGICPECEIERKALELCWKIETLPASELQTEVSVMASGLHSEIKQLAAEREALKYELTKLQWQPTKPGPDRQYCCPVCGGNKEYSGHDTACELAALIDPYKAETYKEMTGGDIIKMLLFCKANGF